MEPFVLQNIASRKRMDPSSENRNAVDEVVARDAPRFNLFEQRDEICAYMEENGYVVLANVFSEGDVARGKELFWSFIAEESKDRGINPTDERTWKRWPGDSQTGIISGDFNHSEFLWHTRLHPNVKSAFSLLWGTEELITSFDGGNTFRPWDRVPAFKTKGGWWHVDQSCLRGPERQGKVSIQGLVTFYDADESTGGFAVIPGSHRFHEVVCRQAPRKVDFVPILGEFPAEIKDLPRILVRAKAGDMIFWDSRTVHCNVPALTSVPKSYPRNETSTAHVELLRLVSYVCMQPKAMASEKAIETKRLAMIYKIPTTHWATNVIDEPLLEVYKNIPENNPRKVLQNASDEKMRLCGFSEEEIQLRRFPGDNSIFSACRTH